MSLIELKHVSKSYSKDIFSVDKFSMNIDENQVVGLVGESGCGKSSIANMILKLEKIDAGKILFKDKDIDLFSKDELRDYRKNVQVVFQNVTASINSKLKILDVIAEPLINFTNMTKGEIKQEVIKVIKKVGLEEEDIYKKPGEFSGGQIQRICIARAIISNPKLIIFDEATSSLDVSIQSQIINLLLELKKEYKISYLFISHDLGLIRYISDIIYVMYLGSNIEILKSENLLNKAIHPYTKLLLSSVPQIGGKNILEVRKTDSNDKGEKSYCKFYSRCNKKGENCKSKIKLKKIDEEHKVACHLI